MSEVVAGGAERWDEIYEDAVGRILGVHERLQDRVDTHTRNDRLFDASLASFDQVLTAAALEDRPLGRYCLAAAGILAEGDLESMNLPKPQSEDRQIRIPAVIRRGAGEWTDPVGAIRDLPFNLIGAYENSWQPLKSQCVFLVKAIEAVENSLQYESYDKKQAELIEDAVERATNIAKFSFQGHPRHQLPVLKMAIQIAGFHQPSKSRACNAAALKTHLRLLGSCDWIRSKRVVPLFYEIAENYLLFIHTSAVYATDTDIEHGKIYVVDGLRHLGEAHGVNKRDIAESQDELIDMVLPNEHRLQRIISEAQN